MKTIADKYLSNSRSSAAVKPEQGNRRRRRVVRGVKRAVRGY